ncbi:5005_t:CDS:2 [Dentiscutata erythropus]|uniref:5005_t:CDS:1 n=1 Tax=Dentiscutata erythropus TaxID=1348616 RepID=A0A9N9NFQ2_9GLOM|nr:5005_t:CDS:2 [Dentiscutata erythropus]
MQVNYKEKETITAVAPRAAITAAKNKPIHDEQKAKEAKGKKNRANKAH